MKYISVDVESDGPCPGLYSMHEFGAVDCMNRANTFHATLKPISDKYEVEALAVCNRTREDTLKFEDPEVVMKRFGAWLESFNQRIMFISDNNGFDWQFINYYLHRFYGKNPFGFSSFNIGSFAKGCAKNMFYNFKHLRDVKHTHNALDDAQGNAGAFVKLLENHGVSK